MSSPSELFRAAHRARLHRALRDAWQTYERARVDLDEVAADEAFRDVLLYQRVLRELGDGPVLEQGEQPTRKASPRWAA